MQFWKRAWLSVTRRKGKSLVLFILVFVLGNVIAGAIAVQQATVHTEKNMKQQLGGNATIDVDIQKIQELSKEDSEASQEIPSITEKTAKQVGELPYVKYYDYSIQASATTKKLKAYQTKDTEEMQPKELKNLHNFFMKGVHYAPVMDIKQGKIKLVEGRVFSDKETQAGEAVALVSKKTAEDNNLHVGEKMVVDDTYISTNSDDEIKVTDLKKDFTFEVIGIFETVKSDKKDSKNQQTSSSGFDEAMAFNTIYAPNKVIDQNQKVMLREALTDFPKDFEVQNGYDPKKAFEEPFLQPSYVLKSPEDVDAFKKEAKPFVPDMYKIYASSDQYDKIAGSVKSMRKMANIVLTVAIIATVLIISLVVILFLRDRKHELGIYLSLGEKKSKVIAQVVIEIVVICFVAITMSLFTGNMLAKGLSDTFIQQETKKESEKTAESDMIIFERDDLTETNLTSQDIQKNYTVKMNFSYVLSFYGASLAVILLSTIIPLFYILRLNPKKIML